MPRSTELTVKRSCSSVNQQVEEGRKAIATGHLFDHTGLLEDLALKKAGPVSHPEENACSPATSMNITQGRGGRP